MSKRLEVIEEGYIETPYDFVKLDIVEWRRHREPQKAMDAISSWFCCTSRYTILKVNMFDYPERDDFPGWNHVGHHEEMGKLYWNFFHGHFKNATLHFADSPDFFGSYFDENGVKVNLYGDIGHVSPIGMRTAISDMKRFDNWVTVVDASKQIVIQPFMDICRLDEMTDEEFLLNLAPYVKYPEKLFGTLPKKTRKKQQDTMKTPSLWD